MPKGKAKPLTDLREVHLPKPIFTPSSLFNFGCGLRYYLGEVQRLTTSTPINAPPTLGTLIHAGEETYDAKRNYSGIDREIQKFKAALVKTQYEDFGKKLLDQLRDEAFLVVRGGAFLNGKNQQQVSEGYAKWRARQMRDVLGDFAVVAVEERKYVDLGGIIIAPQFDMVVQLLEEDGKPLYVWSRKSTAGESDSWHEKWRLSHQTYSEMLAVEETYGKRMNREVRGAILEPVAYARQKRKGWESDLPQPFSSITRNDVRTIRRDPTAEALFRARLDEIAGELAERIQSKKWIAHGLTNGMCHFCHFDSVCRGELPTERLVPKQLRDVDLEIDKRKLALLKQKKQKKGMIGLVKERKRNSRKLSRDEQILLR